MVNINSNYIDKLGHLIDQVKNLDIDRLEVLVQRAHECHILEKEDPPEKFAVTRQALRMLWMFRRNIDNLEIYREIK